MILGLFNIINPLWEFFIVPMALVAFGWYCSPRFSGWCAIIFDEASESEQPTPSNIRLLFPPEDSPELYDWQNDPDYCTGTGDEL
jgi:hypothetical protein